MRAIALLLNAFVIVGCGEVQQRGNFNPMEDLPENQAGGQSVESTEAAEDTEQEEFQLMAAYDDDALNAITGFVEWNVAIDALKTVLADAGHEPQRIKTAPLFGGIALYTSTDSAYLYKEDVLYTANPYAVAYSPDLPKAPPEVDHDAVRGAIMKREQAQRDAAGNLVVTREDRIDAAFGEFVALINYANANIDGANYTTDFLDAVEFPLTADTMVNTINQFNAVLDTIGRDYPTEYKGLTIDQSQLLYTYGRISPGMTLEQVESLLGEKGEEFDRVSNSSGDYVSYIWRGFAESSIFVFMREGTVFEKVTTGLV